MKGSGALYKHDKVGKLGSRIKSTHHPAHSIVHWWTKWFHTLQKDQIPCILSVFTEVCVVS